MPANTRRLPRYLPRLRTLVVTLLFSLTVVRPAAAIDFTDLWATIGENAWGVNLVQSDTFMFATFFIYGPDQQPTWYTGQMTLGTNGVWSGPLYRSTGSYFGAPWSEAQKTIAQVGSVTFTPSPSALSYAGTLTYNVDTVNVSKQITRLTLTTIPLGGTYAGAFVSIFSNCNDTSLNGSVAVFNNVVATQVVGGQLRLDLNTSDATCTLAGQYVQNGQLYRIPNATYTCGTAFTSTAQVSQVKATAQGIEGQWVAPVGGGCIESGYFSAVFLQ